MSRNTILATLTVIALLALCSCGFEPMLAAPNEQSSVAANFAKIKVGYIDNRSGQILRNNLIDTLTPQGEPSQPEYTLAIRIEEPQQNLSFQRNNSVTNANYGVRAFWSLLDNNGAAIYSSNSSTYQQYAVASSPYAAVVSAQDARDQVIVQISQDIRNKLAQYFLTREPAATRSDH